MLSESSFSKPPTLAPSSPSYQNLLSGLIRNAESTSRTMKTGTIDTSASKEKTGTDKNVTEVKDQTRENIKIAAKYIFDKKNDVLTSADDIKNIVADLNHLLGVGFDDTQAQQDESYNLRTHEISLEKRYGVPATEIKNRMNQLYQELFEKIKMCEAGKIESWHIAAWIEFQIDTVLHPYADRCGRMSKILSAYILHRFGKNIPDYGTREEYYAASWNKENDTHEKMFNEFKQYYKAAFEKENS